LAEETYSFEVGCEVGCHYCWARANALRWGLIKTPKEWFTPRTNLQKVNKGWRKRDGVIMFPGTHNICDRNLDHAIKILTQMAQAGNYILITTKPWYNIVSELVTALRPYKAQILFRFSIGSHRNEVLQSWEPHGPSFFERHHALIDTSLSGFSTSVSAEPLLGGVETALALLQLTRPYITNDLWFGFMRKIDSRVVTSPGIVDGWVPLPIEDVKFLHSRETALQLERLAALHPGLIRLKDSVRTAAVSF